MDENEEGYYIEECIAEHGLQTEDVWYKAFAGLDTRHRKLYSKYVS